MITPPDHETKNDDNAKTLLIVVILTHKLFQQNVSHFHVTKRIAQVVTSYRASVYRHSLIHSCGLLFILSCIFLSYNAVAVPFSSNLLVHFYAAPPKRALCSCEISTTFCANSRSIFRVSILRITVRVGIGARHPQPVLIDSPTSTPRSCALRTLIDKSGITLPTIWAALPPTRCAS